MNSWALLWGAIGLLSIVTVYYVFLRKQTKQEQPQEQA